VKARHVDLVATKRGLKLDQDWSQRVFGAIGKLQCPHCSRELGAHLDADGTRDSWQK
jgi:hypothetical protein